MGKARLESLHNDIEYRLSEIGIDLVDIEYIKENGGRILRIVIDCPGGVTLNTCTIATRALKDMIDEQDIYYDHLELTSPGIDRILKNDQDFIRFLGSPVKVNTRKGYGSKRFITGLLYEFNQDSLSLIMGEEIQVVPRDMITQVRLQPDA